MVIGHGFPRVLYRSRCNLKFLLCRKVSSAEASLGSSRAYIRLYPLSLEIEHVCIQIIHPIRAPVRLQVGNSKRSITNRVTACASRARTRCGRTGQDDDPSDIRVTSQTRLSRFPLHLQVGRLIDQRYTDVSAPQWTRPSSSSTHVCVGCPDSTPLHRA